MDESFKLVDNKFAVKFDEVMRAIADNRKLRFRYCDIGSGNKKKLKRDGEYYQISPYYLGVWNHEYFVVANTDGHNNVSFYRVEMMSEVSMLEEAARPMAEIDELKSIGKNGRTFSDFIKESIHLRNGAVTSVKLSGINHIRLEVMKKFGNNVSFRDKGEERFTVSVDVADSEGFYQWLAQFGSNIKIESPKKCIEKYKQFLTDTLEQY